MEDDFWLRRIFLEIGLFSGLSKPEVSEYIAARSKARRKTFAIESPQAAPLLCLQPV